MLLQASRFCASRRSGHLSAQAHDATVALIFVRVPVDSTLKEMFQNLLLKSHDVRVHPKLFMSRRVRLALLP